LYKTPNKEIGVSHLSRKNEQDWVKFHIEFEINSQLTLISPFFYLISKPPEYYKRTHPTIEQTQEETQDEPKKKKFKYPTEQFTFTNLPKSDEVFLNSFTNSDFDLELSEVLKMINFQTSSNYPFVNPFVQTFDVVTPKNEQFHDIDQYFLPEEETSSYKRNSGSFDNKEDKKEQELDSSVFGELMNEPLSDFSPFLLSDQGLSKLDSKDDVLDSIFREEIQPNQQQDWSSDQMDTNSNNLKFNNPPKLGGMKSRSGNNELNSNKQILSNFSSVETRSGKPNNQKFSVNSSMFSPLNVEDTEIIKRKKSSQSREIKPSVSPNKGSKGEFTQSSEGMKMNFSDDLIPMNTTPELLGFGGTPSSSSIPNSQVQIFNFSSPQPQSSNIFSNVEKKMTVSSGKPSGCKKKSKDSPVEHPKRMVMLQTDQKMRKSNIEFKKLEKETMKHKKEEISLENELVALEKVDFAEKEHDDQDDCESEEEEEELITQFSKLQFSSFSFGKLHQQISDVLIFFQK
jgi:hypothetical protein